MAIFDYKETIVTDPVTGGQKGDKLAKMGCLDPIALMRLAEVAGMGAEKYDSYNFMKGYSWQSTYNAIQRHLNSFWAGEYLDDQSGLPHLAHAMWHCHTLISFYERGLGADDRPPTLRRNSEQE